MATWVQCARFQSGKKVILNLDLARMIYEGEQGGTIIEFPTFHGPTDVQVEKIKVTATLNELAGAVGA